jgi:hypothetical protein
MSAPDTPTAAELASVISDARQNGDYILTGSDVAWDADDDRAKSEHRATSRSQFYRPPSNQTQAESDREDRRWSAARR